MKVDTNYEDVIESMNTDQLVSKAIDTMKKVEITEPCLLVLKVDDSQFTSPENYERARLTICKALRSIGLEKVILLLLTKDLDISTLSLEEAERIKHELEEHIKLLKNWSRELDDDVDKIRYTHDCDECIYLGKYEDNDLYFCDQGGRPTVIARFGSEGWEYTSSLTFVKSNKRIAFAHKLAVEKGLLDD